MTKLVCCARCAVDKPRTEYAKSSAKRNGLQSYCRACATTRRKDSAPTKYNAELDRWRQMKYKYGLTQEGFLSLWDSQGGCCAVCASQLSRTEKRGVNVDHNHETGEVRGLLCETCNTGLGLLKDSVDVLEAAITYLKTKGSYGQATTGAAAPIQ